MRRYPLAAAAAALPGLVAMTAPAASAPVLPDFTAAVFVPGAAVDNVYLPLVPGTRSQLFGRGEDDGETFTELTRLTVFDRGPTILGVRATTVLDRAYEDGLLVEKTKDYFAQDTVGNVWYLGEDVTNYRYDDDGVLIGTDSESAWRAGVNGALPGFAMPQSTTIGFNYYQEFAPADEALDQGTTFAILDQLEVMGLTYANVLQVFETNPLEPDSREFKYYEPGVGIIRTDEGLDESLANPELVMTRVAAPIPLPAGVWLLGAGALSLFGLRRRRRR